MDTELALWGQLMGVLVLAPVLLRFWAPPGHNTRTVEVMGGEPNSPTAQQAALAAWRGFMSVRAQAMPKSESGLLGPSQQTCFPRTPGTDMDTAWGGREGEPGSHHIPHHLILA